ncbi:DUF1016 N-terminal domain-containing protein [Microcoleus vaginatus]|uniref:DUF1016 N-terminal domain-containing protein n=1 Tax=Microcoleus vaginatus TaxID=119532 RepID=UPI00403F368D
MGGGGGGFGREDAAFDGEVGEAICRESQVRGDDSGKSAEGGFLADSSSIAEDYHDFLRELKEPIVQYQVRAVLSVNCELVLLYWPIGRNILNRQQQRGWGAKVIDNLGVDLETALPEMMFADD